VHRPDISYKAEKVGRKNWDMHTRNGKTLINGDTMKLNFIKKQTICVILSYIGFLCIVLSSIIASSVAADDKLNSNCEKKLEQARLWIRATDARAPKDEKNKVQRAVAEANSACELARKANPTDGSVLIKAAYALFAAEKKQEGVKLINRASELGYPPAMVMVARYMGRGEYFEKDSEGAWMLLIKTLKTDHVPARIKAALEFLSGGVGPENPKRAKRVLQELIDKGNGSAMITYAMKILGLRKSKPGSDQAQKGIALLQRAAHEAKNPQALIFLSLLYNQGNIVPRNEQKAIQYAELAIDAGIVRAYGTMGQIFQNQGDMEEAVRWFRKGAKKEDGFSQGMLGFMYSGGFGVKQDLDKAIEWWTKARWNGDRMASSYLQVHREKEAARKAWEKEQKTKKEK